MPTSPSTLHTFVRKSKLLARSVVYLLQDRPALPVNLRRLAQAFRTGGLHSLKGALLSVANGAGPYAWTLYRRNFKLNVRPRIVQRIQEDGAPVTISVVVPTYNTPAWMLKAMLRSVQEQLYPNWELCVADDGSSQPHVRKILERHAANDKRIKLYFADTNRGVSHASNRALAMATGAFTVLLDHDDLLEEQALFRVAESVAQDDPDMLYSDEALMSHDGKMVLNYIYRPAFSAEFLRGHPYIVHMVGFRTGLLRQLGGFDETLKISQDYDLILRASEKARVIVHLPEILYRWRIHASSAGHQKVNEVMAVSTAAIQRHLDRSQVVAKVESGYGFNFFDPQYAPREARVAIVIPTKNHGELLKQCIDSIHATVSNVAYDIVVIDHASTDPDSLAYFASIASQVTLLRYAGPFNFSAINNWAVAQLAQPYTHYLFCNNDIEAYKPGWLDRMLVLAQQPSVGMVGAELLYPDRTHIQHAGVCIGAFGSAEHYGKFLAMPPTGLNPYYIDRLVVTHEVSAVTAACLLVRAEVFAEIDGFDEALAVGFGDIDLCLRAGAKGWRILYCPQASLIHHESFTRGKTLDAVDPHPEDSALFRARWATLLAEGDPFFSPGLSLEDTTWRVKKILHCSFDIRRRVVTRNDASGRLALHQGQVASPVHA
ncbi:MAG: glycosyl transferase family 2 [Rhodoferax sp.]|nr:glycosyl transferase family 2 [Rhodoferax sp.]